MRHDKLDEIDPLRAAPAKPAPTPQPPVQPPKVEPYVRETVRCWDCFKRGGW